MSTRACEGRVLCDATAAECRCAKEAGHVEAGDDVHACNPRECTGQWAGTFDDSRPDGGADFRIVALPRPVR